MTNDLFYSIREPYQLLQNLAIRMNTATENKVVYNRKGRFIWIPLKSESPQLIILLKINITIYHKLILFPMYDLYQCDRGTKLMSINMSYITGHDQYIQLQE